MFYKKNKKIDVAFWMFGIIALGIIIATGVLLFQLFSHVHRIGVDASSSMTDRSSTQPPRHMFTPAELMNAYRDDVETLQADMASSTLSADGMLEMVEKELLSMRVPREMQSAHLAAVLEITQMRADVSQQDDIHGDIVSLTHILERLRQ